MTLTKLREIAKAATPGPWNIGHVSENSEHVDVDGPDGYTVADVTLRRDSQYIATFNPALVQALLDCAEAAARVVELADDHADSYISKPVRDAVKKLKEAGVTI